MKTYYFPNTEHCDGFFGRQDPVCVDLAELCSLADGWEVSFDQLRERVHEATAEEIRKYGVYDSPGSTLDRP